MKSSTERYADNARRKKKGIKTSKELAAIEESAAKEGRTETFCPICGQPIPRNQTYCSSRCEKDALSLAGIGEDPGRLTRVGDCPVCGKPVYQAVGKMRHLKVYCSTACHARAAYERRRAASKACVRGSVEMQARICAQCGEEFTPTKSDQTYCGHSCAMKASWARRRMDRRF